MFVNRYFYDRTVSWKFQERIIYRSYGKGIIDVFTSGLPLKQKK